MTDWHGQRYITSKKLLEKIAIEEFEKKEKKNYSKFNALEEAVLDDPDIKYWNKLKPRHCPSLVIWRKILHEMTKKLTIHANNLHSFISYSL